MTPRLAASFLGLCMLCPTAAQAGGTPGQAEPNPSTAAADPVRATILKAIRWVSAHGAPVNDDPNALLFPGIAERPKDRQPQIYGGNAGLLLFLENAAAVLRDPHAHDVADNLARGLLATRRKTDDGHLTWMKGMTEGATSLYVGDAGVGQAFLVRALLRDDKNALQTATEVGDSIIARGKPDGDKLSWDRQVEIIYGASGTILFLLDLGEATKEARFVDAAKAAGYWLISQAKTETKKSDDGVEQRLLSWRWAIGGNRPYVNFSHGTAGVAYALARVGAVAKDAACAQAALDGAAWLGQQAMKEGDHVSWPVIAGINKATGGWCHGAPGTGRLYLLLHQITGEQCYLDTARASARWVMAQAPASNEAAASPAFPPSFCCGVAGVVDFFCDLYRATGEGEFRSFAQRAGDYLIAAAKPDGEGLKWAQGATAHGAQGKHHSLDLMLGAPGEALALLRVLTIDVKPDPIKHLPDRRVGM